MNAVSTNLWKAADAPRSVGQQRMLVVDPLAGVSFDTTARRLPELLHPGDLVVVNDAATLPASRTSQPAFASTSQTSARVSSSSSTINIWRLSCTMTIVFVLTVLMLFIP